MSTRSEPKTSGRLARLSSLALMAAILVVAGTLSALTAMRFAIRGREVAVPELIGKTEEEARRLLEDKGLAMRVSNTRFSELPEGRVVEQFPNAGARLKTSRSVRVLLSLGNRKYAVPNLVGASRRAAELTLAQSHLRLGATLYAHTTEGEPDTIVYQSPPPGSQGGADPSVNILISRGPQEQYYIMPDLIGRPAELVASRARSEGFRVGKLSYRKSQGVEPGVVIQQKPQAGYRVSKNDTIFLDVSQ